MNNHNDFLQICVQPVVINYNPGCKVGYLAILNTGLSACRAAEQSQVGYQGPGEPENIQRVERGAVREDHFCFLEMEVQKNIVLKEYQVMKS